MSLYDFNRYNRNSPSLTAVKEKIEEGLIFLKDEGMIDASTVQESLDRVKTFDNMEEALAGVDYVQEALPEDLKLKQQVFARAADLTEKNVVIGSSCSGLRRSDIVKEVKHHPERCIVAHPTNPPHLIPFMEISGDEASAEAKEATFKFMEYLGQKPIKCREVYGYVLNRVQLDAF
ncbi:MAG: 3-hydroxyacyl-CoA dehydrogenase NAD-binding domain-containing protein [Desulfitobacteriaceae bacterium]|nr:3-hydroxyacyl-CoA dehydrogenase NAD-binding domain-containing protein [Desulfitobacteriaceae bacterium]MDD4752740.1 3-hydroxyacyl-CoA dehydrogenase NAD-binding domain-containing protein [Desulfitobacteriaceae bacterium]